MPNVSPRHFHASAFVICGTIEAGWRSREAAVRKNGMDSVDTGASSSGGSGPQPHTRRLPILALALWAVFAFAVPYSVQTLNAFEVLDFRLGYFMNAEGSLLAFVLIAIVSAFRQGWLDARQGSGK